ncbi:ribonuclease HII [Flavobacteriaceae bacterium]|jgi:ribonuclease HII|nr:ribonuclease HII [Flavobacteriaceae bacterium]|tara:strand:- start:3212 stop:3811 length:600 start_codon:yes stop_codon:yes gene_type:complete
MLMNNFSNSNFEAGVDEAGRGSLAGPLTAAAVILPKDYENDALDDSKKLSEKKRFQLKSIIEKDSIDFAVFFISPFIIDKINILNSTFKAMHGALNNLKTIPSFIVVDGNKFKKFKNINHKCVVKGDAKYQNIAAASILAKTYRDSYMIDQHNRFPVFGWDKNKGYGTEFHITNIKKYGISELHRKSFVIKKSQTRLEL